MKKSPLSTYVVLCVIHNPQRYTVRRNKITRDEKMAINNELFVKPLGDPGLEEIDKVDADRFFDERPSVRGEQQQDGQTDKKYTSIELIKEKEINDNKNKLVKELSVHPPFNPVLEDTTLTTPPIPVAAETLKAKMLKAWQNLKGHTFTNNKKSKQGAFLSDGTDKSIARLDSTDSFDVEGAWASKQICGEAGWKTSDAKSFRTFVIERDDGLPMETQKRLFEDSGIPTSFLVWSGKKSIHAWTILKDAISEDLYREVQGYLRSFFPEADQSVLKNPNGLCRIPILTENYQQPLLDYNGEIENEAFFSWLEAKKVALQSAFDIELKKQEAPKKSAKKLIEIFNSSPGETRFTCPICEQRESGDTDALVIHETEPGKLLFRCHRCFAIDGESQLKRLLFEKNNPNELLDELGKELEKNYIVNVKNYKMYRRTECEFYVEPIGEDLEKRAMESSFEYVSRKLGIKVRSSELSNIALFAKNKLRHELDLHVGKLIALQDGSMIKLDDPHYRCDLNGFTSLALPMSYKDWVNADNHTPVWDSFIKRHVKLKEDRNLFLILMGLIFSGAPVSNHGTMLIIKGKSDTGKSLIPMFLRSVLPHHCVNCNPIEALKKPILAQVLLGARVATSTEAAIKAKDEENLRALISGERLNVKLLYTGEGNYEINTIFVCVTNNPGFIRDVPENRKRIRMIPWEYPVAKAHQDHKLSEKLIAESSPFIAKCLKAFAPYQEKSSPMNKATYEYMESAGMAVSVVNIWIRDRKIKPGKKFYKSSILFRLFQNDTDSKMAANEFGRKFTEALGEDFSSKKDNSRGYLLSELSECE